MKILIVDDDPITLVMLKNLLSRYGPCDLAGNGQDAVIAHQLACRKLRNYDLICMDLMMPVMDGVEAIRSIRRFEYLTHATPCRILVISGKADIASISNAIEGGCNSYLVKPVHLTELRKELKTLGLVHS